MQGFGFRVQGVGFGEEGSHRIADHALPVQGPGFGFHCSGCWDTRYRQTCCSGGDSIFRDAATSLLYPWYATSTPTSRRVPYRQRRSSEGCRSQSPPRTPPPVRTPAHILRKKSNFLNLAHQTAVYAEIFWPNLNDSPVSFPYEPPMSLRYCLP